MPARKCISAGRRLDRTRVGEILLDYIAGALLSSHLGKDLKSSSLAHGAPLKLADYGKITGLLYGNQQRSLRPCPGVELVLDYWCTCIELEFIDSVYLPRAKDSYRKARKARKYARAANARRLVNSLYAQRRVAMKAAEILSRDHGYQEGMDYLAHELPKKGIR